jgi:hypothetical protein
VPVGARVQRAAKVIEEGQRLMADLVRQRPGKRLSMRSW